ncbi:unnamed protein product [marine sediment metagenome]|uniref:Uncharacterized protein n=1 Tax=marine sediment metagenome TaxID=412755 RepID=X0TVU4_9ZZZZ
MKKNLSVWLKGLVGGVIGGVANGILLLNLVPEAFGEHELVVLGKVVGVTAITSMALYLKEKPLPGVKGG